MELRETTRLSWTNIRSHKLRNFLAVLSVTIGIAAVIAVVTMTSGFQEALLNTITKDLLRANMISVSAEGSGQSLFGADRVFSQRDVERVRELEGVKAADVFAPVNGNPLKYRGQLISGANVRITTSKEVVPLDAGRFVQGPGEIVVGVEVAREICEQLLAQGADVDEDEIENRCEHPGRTPEVARQVMDERVELTYIDSQQQVHRGDKLDIVGIVKESEFIGSRSSYVTTHYQGYTEVIDEEELPVYTGIVVSVAEIGQVQDVADRLEAYFESFESDARKLLGDETEIQVNTLQEIVDEIKTQFGQFTTWLGAVAVVALLVGMIGVMNIMLITVKERTREIGIMKATGATQGGVLKLFLTESVFICAIGAILGIVGGIGLGDLFNRFTVALANLDEPIPLVFVWNWYAIAVATGIAVGVLSGLYPAWQAARVNPIEALRYE